MTRGGCNAIHHHNAAFLALSTCKVSCPRVTMSFMALHFVFHFCAVRALFLTPHSLCYRILFSKLAVQHFNRAYGIRHTAYSEDNGTKVMAFPLHCSNEKESYTLSCFKSTTCSKNDYKNLQLWHLLIMVTETLLVK